MLKDIGQKIKAALLKIAVEFVNQELKNPQFRAELIAEVNKSVDLPFMGEETEASLFGPVYDALITVLERRLAGKAGDAEAVATT